MSQSCQNERKRKAENIRLVPAFTPAALQKNVQTGAPPPAGALKPRPQKSLTRFGRSFNRCEFPIQIEFVPGGLKLAWKVEIERLDFFYYLPMFFEGLMETSHPYDKLAEQACHDMLVHGGSRVTPAVPHVIIPITRALNSRNPQIMARVLRAIQKMLRAHPTVGPALVPYYRQLLPVMSLYKNKNLNIGDRVEYGQQKRTNVSDLINECLEMMEKTGGPHAFINIKYMIPTYESAVLN